MSEQNNAVEDLFMIVICGEFNSGKSSVVNVLLRDCGRSAMSVGSLPTTNAITVIKYTVRWSAVSFWMECMFDSIAILNGYFWPAGRREPSQK